MSFPSCLRCPACHLPVAPPPDAAAHVVCANGHTYARRGGIVDLLGAPTPQTFAATVNEWPLTAWAYERVWRPYALSLLSGSVFPITREAALLRAAFAHPPATVLDVGCANGLYTRFLAQAFPETRIIAVERATPMLREAVRRTGTPSNITWLRADAADLPVTDHACDGIVAGGTFNECEALDAVLHTLARVATPKATLWSMHLVDPHATETATHGRSGVRLFAPTELADRLSATGWEITNTTTHDRVQFVTAKRTA